MQDRLPFVVYRPTCLCAPRYVSHTLSLLSFSELQEGCFIDSFTIHSSIVLVHELLFTFIPISFEFLDKDSISVGD